MDTTARCQGCDYPLRGLESRRCPECGRAFDPADPSTMNLGRPLGRIGRVLLAPTGWWVLGLIVVPTIALCILTRPPVEFMLDLSEITGIADAWRDFWSWPQMHGWSERTSLAARTLLLLAGAIWASGLLLRWGAVLWYKPNRPHRWRWHRELLGVFCLVGGLCVTIYGSPYRRAAALAARASWLWAQTNIEGVGDLSVDAAEHDRVAVALRTGLRWFVSPRDRCIVFLLAVRSLDTEDVLALAKDAMEHEQDPSLKAFELHTLAHYRAMSTVPLFRRNLFHDSREVREAAAAGLACLIGACRHCDTHRNDALRSPWPELRPARAWQMARWRRPGGLAPCPTSIECLDDKDRYQLWRIYEQAGEETRAAISHLPSRSPDP